MVVAKNRIRISLYPANTTIFFAKIHQGSALVQPKNGQVFFGGLYFYIAILKTIPFYSIHTHN